MDYSLDTDPKLTRVGNEYFVMPDRVAGALKAGFPNLPYISAGIHDDAGFELYAFVAVEGDTDDKRNAWNWPLDLEDMKRPRGMIPAEFLKKVVPLIREWSIKAGLQ